MYYDMIYTSQRHTSNAMRLLALADMLDAAKAAGIDIRVTEVEHDEMPTMFAGLFEQPEGKEFTVGIGHAVMHLHCGEEGSIEAVIDFLGTVARYEGVDLTPRMPQPWD